VLLFFLILCVVVLCLVYLGHVSGVLNVASFSETKTGVRELDIYIFVFVLLGEYACNY
jgi:hypothetical protein